jgi:hypothetical protein
MDWEIAKIAANVGGYLVMCFYLIRLGQQVAEKFLGRLIAAIQENTAARLKDAEERARLAEKIDALWKHLRKESKT